MIRRKDAGGVDALLNTMERKQKMSTITKSNLDWDAFKNREGIAEDLEFHNKNGFIEKQKFLNQAQVNEWERERDARMAQSRR